MSIFFNKQGSSRLTLKVKVFTAIAAVTLAGAAAAMPFASMADSTTDALMAQIAALQAQLAKLAKSPSVAATTCNFTRNLTVGLKGEDVTCLQTYLASTGHFTYTGGKGSFGKITKSAVAAWQAANGLTPAAGYFGALSRAKYSMLVASAPAPTPTPTPTPTTSGSPAPAAGTGLTVAAAATQPADGALAPPSAARVPTLNAVFTASSDGDVKINSITVQRVGQADDSAIDSVVLVDDQGTQIGLSKTLNALHQAALNEPVTIKAGTSKTLTIGFNRPVAGSNGGQIAKFQIVSVDAGTAKVNGSFPMVGPGVTINETLTIGAVASPARGVLDPGAARTAIEVGATKFYASGARWTVGSAEAVSLEQIRFYQAGSAGTGDLTNVMVTVGSTDYPTTVSSDGKYYVAKFSPALLFDKGAVIDVAIKTDIAGGSNRTIDFDIQRRTDLVAKGTVFGYYIIPANGTVANTTTQGEGFTSTEPYYDAYQHTISTGTIRVEKSNALPAGNVALGTSNIPIGAFGFEAKGEEIQISSFKVSFSESGRNGSFITGVSLVDGKGATVAGPKDATSVVNGSVTFSDTFTVPVGYNVYTLKAKLSTSFTDGDTIAASTTPSTDITAKGQVTGLSITATPSSGVAANTMTVRKAALKVSVADTPVAQNVVRGITGFLFSKLQFDGTASGEDLRVSAQDMVIVVSGSADPDSLNTCQMFDGTTALNTGGNVVNPSGNAAGTNIKATFTLDNNLVIPKGTVKLADVKCNIGQDATAGQTWSLGLSSTGNDTTVVGKDTGTTVTETTVNSNGQAMTVQSGGSMSVILDPASPNERFGIAGQTDVGASVFQLSSQFEAVKLTKFGFVLASSTASTSDVLKVAFWDGATKVGEAVFSSGEFRATSTLSGNFIVPKDGQKMLSSTVDLISKDSIGKAATTGGDSGHLVVINWDGFTTTATEGIGQASGNTINTAQGSYTSARGLRVVRAYPTLTRLTLPTNTLTNGDMDLYRFSVAAPTSGDIGLYKFTFRVSSTTVATTSSFRVFAYTDSGMSNPAYAINPINSNDVSCVGGSSMETTNITNCNANTNVFASTTQVSVLFDPLTNTPTAPNAEAIQIPAGQTRYFKLVGNVTRSTTGDAFTVALVGDASFFPTLTTPGGSGIAADTLTNASTVASTSFFVWSPNTTTTAATTSNDWLNGYLLPGLPTTEMSQQSLSK